MIEHRAKYLMLEDNGADVEIAFFDFQENGMETDFQVSINATEAVDYLFEKDGTFKAEPPKVIFIDLHLPKISGLEFLRIIQKNLQAGQIPIVAMLSSASPSELEECKRLGVKRFIQKPFDYANFISSTKELSDNPLVTTPSNSNPRLSKNTEAVDS